MLQKNLFVYFEFEFDQSAASSIFWYSARRLSALSFRNLSVEMEYGGPPCLGYLQSNPSFAFLLFQVVEDGYQFFQKRKV